MMTIFDTKLLCVVIFLHITLTNSFKLAKRRSVDYDKGIIYNSQVNAESHEESLNPFESLMFNQGPEYIVESLPNEEVNIIVRKKSNVRNFHFKATSTPITRNKKIEKLVLPYSEDFDDDSISNNVFNNEFTISLPTTSRHSAHTPQYAFNMNDPAYKRVTPISYFTTMANVVKSKRQQDILGYPDTVSSHHQTTRYFVEAEPNINEESANSYKKSEVDFENDSIKKLASVAEKKTSGDIKTVLGPDSQTIVEDDKIPSSYHVKDFFTKNVFLNYDDVDFDDIKLLSSSFENISATNLIDDKTKPKVDLSNLLNNTNKIRNNTKHIDKIVNIRNSFDDIESLSSICTLASPANNTNLSTTVAMEISVQDDNTTKHSVYRQLLMRNILNHNHEAISKKTKALLEKLNHHSVGEEDESSKLVVFNDSTEIKMPPRPKHPSLEPSRSNTRPLWKEFSFMGLYIHEPSHLYCDAAAISPHWLIASGICLNRHIKKHVTDTRSAYVAYCGPNWRQPSRVAYVKYSLQHPRFEPNDPTRSQLYNVGLIRVGNSMNKACTDWNPVQLMSYKFSTDKSGVTAQAIGWGLDRYSVKGEAKSLPTWPLLMYEGVVHSESCPGNSAYQKLKLHGVSSNMYCLMLPTYLGDERDPAHGSFLISGGKLFAIYLTEERKGYGEQSAVYTGIWKVIPWIWNMAMEPENPDLVLLEV